MKRITIIILTLVSFTNCNSSYSSGNNESTPHVRINNSESSILKRIDAPDGYQWVKELSGSFGEFLQQTALKQHGSSVLDYSGRPIHNQSEHIAVLDYEVGNQDLQQCADAAIRLRAEYLFENNRQEEIGFHFTSGHYFSWNDYKKGIRPIVENGNRVSFNNVAAFDDSYRSFRKYLNTIFAYAGSISLNKETKAVRNNDNIQSGDMLITPGSPGHVVMIVGRAKNNQGNMIYLLAQGYTPAQSIHIITNPFNRQINPWYTLSTHISPTRTARYTFQQTNIRSFHF
jgi:hypothetical protein